MELYDSIGCRYGERRRADPRIATRIHEALGGCRSLLNVGAGAGSYEPQDREVIAVEPSAVMIRQRPPAAAPAVQASATELPFRDSTFDASLAILTIHHWPDLSRGLHELRRTARKAVVILTFDSSAAGFWLTDYFPGILEIDRRRMPSLSTIRRHLGKVSVADVPIPHDCTDGFLCAYWRRPHAYLDRRVRSAISVFTRITGLKEGLAHLARDLRSGVWRRRYGRLLTLSELDLGYRLVVAREPRSTPGSRTVASRASFPKASEPGAPC